jgi:Tol biopolymer transport system component
MKTNERFERSLAGWLHEDAAFRVPDHLSEVLSETRETRQRSAWSSLERWLPVDTTFLPRPFSVPSAGRLLAVAMLILLILAVAVFAIGSQHRLPAPFGIAANGDLIGSRDGDLYRLDATTGQSTLLVGDPAFDFGASFSRDGTKFVFLRSDERPPTDAPAVLTMLMANADGTDLHAITGPTSAIDWWDWSPDGAHIAYVASGQLWVVDFADGARRMLPGTKPAHFPTWLPPDGREIVFRQEGTHPKIMAIRPDGTGLHELTTTPARNQFDYQGPTISPDGSVIAFTRYSEFGEPSGMLLDLRTGEERRLPVTDGTRAETGGPFAPNGDSIAFVRYYRDATWQLMLAPIDGSGEGSPIGPRSPGTPQDGEAGVSATAFTPDGSALLVRYGDDTSATTRLLPLDGSAGRIIDTGEFQFVDMQRLAP